MFDKKLFESKYVEPENRVPVDTLILIGNGFDSWQNMPTSYSFFEKYYEEHIDEVLERLHIPKHTLKDKDGDLVTYTDVELFYGDPGKLDDPALIKSLPHEFWMDFEASLNKIDDQGILYYFGKKPEEVRQVQVCANNAQRILREIFSNWIMSLNVDERPSEYDFGSSLFVNFNYTDTLLKRFGVNEKNEFHIHGMAADKNSIVFGHSTHPELAYPGIPGGVKHPRYQGLYYIEEFLYNSDKHIEDNYLLLRIFLAMHGVRIEDIKKIYILGLGFGPADLGYIKNLFLDTEGLPKEREPGVGLEEKKYLDSMNYENYMMLNIAYAASHRERVMGKNPISYPELEAQDELLNMFMTDPYYHIDRDEQIILQSDAVRRRFWEEQDTRDKKVKREYLRLLGRKNGGKRIPPEEDCLEKAKEASGAEWHISYYSEKDRKRIESVMKGMGCRNYRLYNSIDECIKVWKKVNNE